MIDDPIALRARTGVAWMGLLRKLYTNGSTSGSYADIV